MEAKSQAMTFAVVALVIGVAAGAGIGFFMWHSDVGEQSYWIYIDYGSAADDSHKNGWVEVKATSSADAVKKIPNVKTSESETYGTSLDGINGVDNKSDFSMYWAQYIRNGVAPAGPTFAGSFSESNYGLGGTYSTVLYLYYGPFGDIPTDTAWATTGPFKA